MCVRRCVLRRVWLRGSFTLGLETAEREGEDVQCGPCTKSQLTLHAYIGALCGVPRRARSFMLALEPADREPYYPQLLPPPVLQPL